MKYFLSIFFLCYVVNVNSQVLYDELEPHNAENVNLLYVANDGTFIGSLPFSDELVASYNKGLNWEIIDKGEIKPSSWFKINVKQDNEDKYYFNQYLSIFSTDDLSSEMKPWYYSAQLFLGDLDVLPNNNVIGVKGIASTLFNPDGEVILEKKYEVVGSELILGNNDIHYSLRTVTSTSLLDTYYQTFLQKFDSNLSLLEEFEVSKQYLRGQIFFEGDRLYLPTRYSDDGHTWFDYPNEISGYLFVHGNEKITIVNDNKLFVSNDRGESFEEHTIVIPFEIEDAFRLDENGIVYYSNKKNDYGIYYSENGIDNWVHLKSELEIGLPFAQKVAVFDSSNLYVAPVDDFNLFRSNNDLLWKNLNDCVGSRNTHMVIDSQGVVVSSNGCRSVNFGITWANSGLQVESPLDIILRNNNHYIIEHSIVHKSTDNGLNWITSNFESDTFDYTGTRQYKFAVTKDENILHSSFLFNTPRIYRKTLEGEKLASYLYRIGEHPSSNILTNDDGHMFWTNQTSTIWNLNTSLYRSLDNGENFESVSLDSGGGDVIFIDRLNNLYLYDHFREWLRISNDYGSTWSDITPENISFDSFNALDVGYDNHLYIATDGTPILRSKEPMPKANLPVSTYTDNQIILDKVTIHPNPSKDYINLDIEDTSKVQLIYVFDSAGKMSIEIKDYNEGNISINALSSGFYTVRIIYKDGSFTVLPLVKN